MADRTTVGVAPDRHTRLKQYKHAHMLESYDAAIDLLLEQAEKVENGDTGGSDG